MKNLLLVGLTILWHAAAAQYPQVVNPQEISQLSWLEGNWKRTDLKPGKLAFEVWEKISENEYTGMGVTMQGGDTSFVEKLRIFVKDNALYYQADVPENPQPVCFKFTELSEFAFVCENPSHDFPKKISYSLSGELLTAIVSGNGHQIEFLFERKAP